MGDSFDINLQETVINLANFVQEWRYRGVSDSYNEASSITLLIFGIRGWFSAQKCNPVRHQPPDGLCLPSEDGAKVGIQSGIIPAGEEAFRCERNRSRGQPRVRIQEGFGQAHRKHVLETQEEPGHRS